MSGKEGSMVEGRGTFLKKGSSPPFFPFQGPEGTKSRPGECTGGFFMSVLAAAEGFLPDYAGAPASREMEDAVARSEGRVSSMKS